VADTGTLPPEMMRDFLPEATPSGRLIRRVTVRSIAESVTRAALGDTVHLTVASFTDHLRHPGITTVPVRDLPPSTTALAWLARKNTPAIQAFAAIAEHLAPPAPSISASGADRE